VETVLKGGDPVVIAASDASQVSAARLALQRMARDLGFDEVREGRVGIVVTEAMTNLLRHGGGGTLSGNRVTRGGAVGVEVLAIDRGPGMADFEASARDGHSTGGTAGTGLGAMQRQADEFDIYTRVGLGTVVRMLVWEREPPPPARDYEVGAILVPKAGESACGDAWAAEQTDSSLTLLVADGLGHGPDASRAAQSAVDVLRKHPTHTALRLMDLAHAKLRATRGAALALMRHDMATGEVAYAGVGNIAACIVDGTSRRAMVSHNGIVGHNVHKSEEYRYPWSSGLLVAHSDGLESHWDLNAFPGITACHPSIIAAMLYRQHSRKRDDVVVVVARRKR
jgi:anti-sigma regulatory factor (Ser/Thr protein kinase)